MRTIALLLFVVAVALASFAADQSNVKYQSGSETVQAMMYTPSGAQGKLPALIVVHEWWGLDDWIHQQAAKLANQGYATLAIDLYRGKSTTDRDEAHQLSRGLPQDRAHRDLRAAFAFLKSQKNVDPARIGVIGWCMGGGYAFDLATLEPTLKAAVINYGHLATEPDTLKKVNANVLGIFGGQDQGIPVDSVKQFEQQMKSMGKNVQIVIFPDAGHAFPKPEQQEGLPRRGHRRLLEQDRRISADEFEGREVTAARDHKDELVPVSSAQRLKLYRAPLAVR